MGVGSIGTRTAGSFGVQKTNQAAITKPERQLSAGEYNRLADAVIEIQQAIGTSVDPGSGSHQRLLNELGSGELASELAGKVGRFNGEFRRCSGVGGLGVGHGTFRWHAGDETPADQGTVLGAGAGRWKRVFDGASVDARWFGVVPDNPSVAASNRTALQAALDFVATQAAGRVILPAGTTYVNDTIVVPKNTALEGQLASPRFGSVSTSRIAWYGATADLVADDETVNKAVVSLKAYSSMRGVGIVNAALGTTVFCGIGLDQVDFATLSSFSLVENCVVDGYAALGGEFRNCLAVNGIDTCTGNIEHHMFRRLCLNNPIESCVLIGGKGGQPYELVFEHCQYSNHRAEFLHGNLAGTPYGYAFTVDNSECTVLNIAPVFDYTGTCIRMLKQFNYRQIGGDGEQIKRFLDTVETSGGSPDFTMPIYVLGMRIGGDGYTRAQIGAAGATVIAAADHRMIVSLFGCPIELHNVDWAGIAPVDDFTFRVSKATPLTIRGGHLGSPDPVARDSASLGGEPSGGTWISGVRTKRVSGGGVTAVKTLMPPRNGPENPDGSKTHTGATTTVTVTFPKAEVSSDYRVHASVSLVSGSPPAGSARGYVVSKSTSGFVYELDVAPGSATVSVDYSLSLPSVIP